MGQIPKAQPNRPISPIGFSRRLWSAFSAQPHHCRRSLLRSCSISRGSEAMGGGADHGGHHGEGDFRAKVWSMSGGPNCRPKHWKRNTAIAMFGVFLTCIPIAMLSAKLEQRPHQPVRPIPSQLWCKNFGNKEYEKR